MEDSPAIRAAITAAVVVGVRAVIWPLIKPVMTKPIGDLIKPLLHLLRRAYRRWRSE